MKGGQGQTVALSEVVKVERTPWDGAIHHKDLLPVVYVMGDEAGELDSPLYGMFDIVGQVSDNEIDGRKLAIAASRFRLIHAIAEARNSGLFWSWL